MAPLRAATLLLSASLALIFAGQATGSYFRYGHLNWKATDKYDSSRKRLVEFTLSLAVRADYRWGEYEGIQWAVGPAGQKDWSALSWYGSEGHYKNSSIAPGWSLDCKEAERNDLYKQKACFKCGAASVSGLDNYIGCVKNDPIAVITESQSFYIRFGRTLQSDGQEVVQCPTSFHCDALLTTQDEDGNVLAYSSLDNSETRLDCDFYLENKVMSDERCAPWDQLFGFFYGDGTSSRVLMEMTETPATTAAGLGEYRYQAISNYIKGTSRFLHGYVENANAPLVAFFTGGDRLLECAIGPTDTQSPSGDSCTSGEFGTLLHNNAEGRFRLETEVWIKGDAFSKAAASPIILMPPIVPIPHMPYGERSKFHVPAYDPLGNPLEFRFATPNEMGGMVRSKSDAFPWAEGLEMANSYNSSLYDEVTGKLLYNLVPHGTAGRDPLSVGTQYGTFYCSEKSKNYTLNGGCQRDRVPKLPPGVAQHSFTSSIPGMIEWNTWVDDDGQPCTAQSSSQCAGRLPNGLYNFVVVASQYTGQNGYGVKSVVDFLAYLYDGPTYFCNKNCMDNKRANPFAASNSLNLAEDNYDASGNYDPKFRGVETFADKDGIYGVDCPIGQEEACKVVGKRQSQSCTICGLAAPERNLCTPAMDDGAGNPNACGVTATNATDGTVSIVPALTACRMNMAPVFVRVKGVVPWPSGSTSQRYIIENPGQELYDASLGQDEYQYPVFRAYRGDVVLFALTAVDRDDCTELSVEATALPEGAVLEPPEYLSEYDEFPEGQMVRRVFRWNGPRLAVTPDERPPASMVCFYATDKYLLTSQPFYCIEILIEEKPSSMEQTLMRFDCKLSLNWNQLLRRFVIIDAPFSGPVQKYYTKCEFEDFMWHHAMVSVQENGDGTLYIDGEAQELVTNVGKNPQELTQFGRGTDVGVTVSLSAYPNQCEPGRRRLMPDDGGPDADVTTADVAGGNQDPLFGKFKENALTDENVDDGFIYDVDPTLNGTGLSCCSFTVASGCSAQTILRLGGAESHSFAGLSDEIAIWNRALSQDEIRETMFKMPQYLPTHKLEAPRGVQLDLAAGRVLYTRFNNPCMEGLAEGTPTAARKLLQLPEDYVYTTGLGSSVWIGGLQFDESRREGISDDAGFTAGTYVDAEGYLKVTSSDNVTATFIGWREHAGYAYTGVPWAAPIVHAVQPEGPVPLDGGVEVVVKGVGFARSPFLKCATIQPDVRGEYVMPSEYEPRATYDGYVNRFLNVDGSFLTHSNPWMYDSFSQVQLTRGKTKFMPDDAAPELHPSSYRDQRNKIYNPFCPDKPCAGKRVPRVNCKDPRNCPELNPLDPQVESRCTTCTVGTRIDWLATNTITHKGQLYPYERISPLPGNLGENYAIEYYYGGWETVTCQAPPGPFPSDMYYIGVSNDAGITGSPPTAITYTEYALRMSNSGRVLTPEVPGKSFSAWFLIEEEAPPCISGSNQTCRTTIFRLTNGVGVSMDYGVVVAKAGMRTLGDMSDEQFIGSLGSNLTTLGEWHHAMLTINGTTIKFYLDGVDVIEETIQGDAPAQGYKLLSFGDGLIGFIDEVKVFKEVLTYDEYLEAMWRREPAETDRMSAYYRLNSWDHPLMDSIGGHDAVCSDGGVCTLRSVASPWEPTTLYSVNGDRKALETGTVSGGEVIDIVGFNFAPSQWLGCAWGVFTQDDGFLLPELEEDGPACPPLPAPEKLHRPDVEGKMGRPDGRRPAVKPYGLMRLSGEPDLFVREAGLVSLSNSLTMRCVTPQLNRSGVYQFAPVSREALVTTTYEFVEVAYECDGLSDYIEVAQAAQMLTNSSAFHIQGYTISMWVLPYSKVGDGQLPMYDHGLDQQFYRPHVPGAPGMMGPVRQALLDPTNYIGVIAAFENPTPTAGPGQRTTFGSLVYNGEEFYYYDDCIADVKSTAPAVSAEPNQWHFIAVAVDADGEGTLYVDGNAADHFTTNCSVPMDSLFSLCASLYENPAADGNLTRFTTSKMPNSHFAGRIDEVELHRGALGWATLESAMFKYDSAGNPEVKYNFSVGCNHISKDCSDVGTLIPNTAPGAMMGDAAPFGGRLVKSTAPWAGAQVLSASLSEASVVGNEPLTIRGHNFAPSQWLKLNLGYGPQEFNYSTPNTMEASTPEGVCHDDLPVSVTNADGIPEKDGSSVWNLEYECTTEGLLTNLVAFYNMDGQQSQVEDLVSVLRDSVGNAHGACPTEYMQADRDGYLRSAFGSLSGNARACAVPAPAMLVGVDDFSVAAWVFLPYFAGADASMTALGGWKLVTYTVENGLATVYAGHQPALQQDREYLLMVMGNFTATGSLSMGLWDDIWVYDRVLRPCEVAGRYFTSSYALDLTKSEEESINGGTKYATVLPWGYGSVAAWVYAYDVHDSQSIVASQNGTFVLGVEQGRVSLAIAPGPGSKCICEPCEKQINYVSWKSRIMPSTWHHVAVSYNGFDAYILVDGVLRDKAIVRERCFDKPKTGGRRRTLLQEKSPGPAAMNEFTRKLQGVRGYGLHPECTVNGSDPDLPTCVHSSPNAQDAIEPQCLPWMLEPDAFMLGREANVDFDHPYLGPDNHMRPFNGLIYDLRSFDSGAEPFEVKALSQCIPKDPLVGGRGDAYIKLNDGVSSKVLAYTVNGKALAVEGVSAGLYRNVSVDDPTHPHATTMFGPGVVGTVNGEPGLLTITARTYCGEKRAIGGDKFKLTLATEGFPLSDGFVEIYDSNDGTYAVSYGGLPSCNIWNATLSMVADGLETEIDRFPIDIIPAATDPTKTEAFIGPADAWTQCANSLNSFLIQARDFHNCPQRDLPDGTSQDVFVVSLRGPADLEAHITYEGDGVHRASFVPPVSGTYFVEVSLQTPEGPAVIANGQQCITVCNDGSMLFTGQGYVEVTEPPTSDGFHYLDGAGLTGFTMEAWVRRFGPSTSGKEAYILIKGTFEEAYSSAFVKGYSMSFSADNRLLQASVYTSLGVLRTVTAPNEVANEVWFHVAAVYNGTTFSLYRNGAQVATEYFDSPRALHHNPYYHPVTVGPGFYGGIDEVKITSRAKSRTEILESFFCPPPMDMQDVILYLSFNSDYASGTLTQGYSEACKPHSREALARTCLQAEIKQHNVANVTEINSASWTSQSPMVQDGAGFISRQLSYVMDFNEQPTTDVHPTLLTVAARDRCGFAFVNGTDGLFQLTLQKYVWNYFSPNPPGQPYPKLETQGAEQKATSTAIADTCRNPYAPTLPYHKGDIHNQKYDFSQAGSYLVRERVNLNSVRGGGDLLEFEVDGPKIATVKAGSPVRMELEGLDATFVAGQPATVYAVAYDQYNNPVFDVFGFIVEITMIGEAWTQELDTVISFDNQTARYSIVFTAPHSPLRGTYTLLVSATDLGTPLTTTPEIPTFRPQPSPWRQVLVDGGDSPPLTHRFEHTSVMYRGDMYVFGGALFDKTYLSHMVVLEGADGHVNRDSFAYVKDIVLNSSLMYDGAPVVEVVINTRELIAAGRMSIRCTDILFKAPSIGESLEFYVDPFPGCNNIQTLVYVKLPEGALANTTSLTITMAYGNAYVIENAYSSPKSLFAFHDSFEEDAIDPRWTAVGSCSMEPLDEPVHTLNHSFAYSGKGSLYVREGQRGALAALLPEKLDRFHLRAWFWDSDHLLSAHFVSPDFEACGATANSDTTLARPNNLFARVTALGTYTMSSRMKYCIGAPWQSVPDDAPRRAAQWRRLEVFSSPEAGMTAMVDGVVVKTAPAVTASRVIIAAGLSVDIAAGAYLEGAHAHWDDISLAAWYPGINATARRMEDDEMVDIVESRGWYSVDTAGSQPPPPRYSHTAVVWGDKMWIFGGERSAYAFNDLWAFDFVSSRWSHVVPKGEELPAPRYDHSAAVLVNGGGVECMVIYGGRNGHQFLSDIWEYCFAAGEWRKVADVTIVSGRFGHAAAAVPGTSAMYVFGGYTDTGFSMDFFKCEAGSCVDITHGCPTTSANEGVAEFVGITPRYGHSMLVTANGKALMMYGGSNLESKDGLPGVYRFDIDACFWEKLNVDGSDPSRYEHVAAVSYGGIIVHGGHSAGTYLNSLSFLPAS